MLTKFLKNESNFLTLALVAVMAITPQLALAADNPIVSILSDGAVAGIFKLSFMIAAIWTLFNMFSDFVGGANFGEVLKKGLVVALLAGLAFKYQDILKIFKDM